MKIICKTIRSLGVGRSEEGAGLSGESSVMELHHLDLDVQPHQLQSSSLTILATVRPHWPAPCVRFKLFTDGITNKLIGCFVDSEPDDVVLVRVYGHNTDLLIDRKAETNNFKVLHKAGYAPRLYATFNNGIAYEFVPGCVLTTESIRTPSVYELVARMMAKLHHVDCGPNVPKKPVLWEKIKHYLSLIPNEFASLQLQNRYSQHFPGGIKCLERELNCLERELSKENSLEVFCHNDLLLANIIHDNGKVTFIDYEYASYNYQPFDIGNHFAEFAGVSDVDYSLYPSKEFQTAWLMVYLEEFKNGFNDKTPIKASEIETLFVQVNKFTLASHLLWATWALVQAYHSTIDFDFMGYAATRIQEYFKKKELFLALGTNS